MAELKTNQSLSLLLNASAILKTGKMKVGLKKGDIGGAGTELTFLQALKKNMSAVTLGAAGGKGPGETGAGKDTNGSSLLKTAAAVGVLPDGAVQGDDSKVSKKGGSRMQKKETGKEENLLLPGGVAAASPQCLDVPKGSDSAAGKGVHSPLTRDDASGSALSLLVKQTGNKERPAGQNGDRTKGSFAEALKTESAVPEDSQTPAMAARTKGAAEGLFDASSGLSGKEADRAKTPAAPGATTRLEAKNPGEDAKTAVRFSTTTEGDGKTAPSAVAGTRDVHGSHVTPRDEMTGSISRPAPSGRELNLNMEKASTDSRGSAEENDPGMLKDSQAFMKERLNGAEGFKEEMSVREHSPMKGEAKAVSAEGPGSLSEGSGLAAAEGSKSASHDGRTAAVVAPDSQALMDRIAQNSEVLMRTGYSRVRLTLSPPQLGTLDLDLSIHRDRIKMVLTAENGEVRHVLQSNMDQLKTTLQDQGLSIDRLDVLVQDRGGDRNQEPSREAMSFGREQTQQGSEGGAGEEPRPAPSSGSYREGFWGEDGISIFA